MSDYDEMLSEVEALLASDPEVENGVSATYDQVFAGILRMVLDHMVNQPQGTTIHVFLQGENIVVGVQPTMLPIPSHAKTMPDAVVARVNALMSFLSGIEKGAF